jgi:hypothetical protein
MGKHFYGYPLAKGVYQCSLCKMVVDTVNDSREVKKNAFGGLDGQ